MHFCIASNKYFFNDGTNDHVITFKINISTDKYQRETFSNLNVYLDFSKSPLSILICQKLSDISNIKTVYKEIDSFTSAFPETNKGINVKDLYKNIISQINREEFIKIIQNLKNLKFIVRTENCHVRAIGENVEQILHKVI